MYCNYNDCRGIMVGLRLQQDATSDLIQIHVNLAAVLCRLDDSAYHNSFSTYMKHTDTDTIWHMVHFCRRCACRKSWLYLACYSPGVAIIIKFCYHETCISLL